MAAGRLAADLACLQPIVVLGGALFGVGRRAVSPVTLVSALGVRHPMRPVASARVWREHAVRAGHDAFVRGVLARIAEGRAGPEGMAVYFLSVLVPRAEGRDWGEDPAVPPRGTPRPGGACPAPDLAAFAAALPAPVVPGPALVASDRVWRLARCGAPAGVHVRVGRGCWSPAGEFLPVAAIDERWRAACDEVVSRAARVCLERACELDAAFVVEALDELRRTGGVQRGSLLFLGSTPPCIGHVMPPHRNVSLGRAVSGDVALATPFRMARSGTGAGGLRAFAKSPQGVWSPLALPRGICIGPGVPQCPPQLEPDLAAVACLRWAATRIATNGRFHEHDGRFDE
jgi:hypothetical protein